MKKIKVLKPVLVSNQQRALENRKVFDQMKSLVVNIIASPGAGKTSFIKRIVKHFKKRYKILVIEGDIKGQIDSKDISKLGVDVIQINTVTECHLDAFMAAQVLPKIKQRYDLILIENVGNLVCPSAFELGEAGKIVVLSVTEGDDKPAKYPAIFARSKVLLINKIDLLEPALLVDFSFERAQADARKLNKNIKIFPVSAKTGAGFNEWCNWLIKLVKSL